MCTPLISSGPSNGIIVDLNKPYIIRNGRELGDLEYLPTKTQGPLNDTIIDLNKSKIIRNSRELTYLDYLPTKQKMWNISRMWTHEPLIFWGPLNYTIIHFK